MTDQQIHLGNLCKEEMWGTRPNNENQVSADLHLYVTQHATGPPTKDLVLLSDTLIVAPHSFFNKIQISWDIDNDIFINCELYYSKWTILYLCGKKSV